MPPLTLVQKRAILAAVNNAQKGEKRYLQAVNAYHNANSRDRRRQWNNANKAARNWQEARRRVARLEAKLGLKHNTNYSKMKLNSNYNKLKLGVISNVLTKHLRRSPSPKRSLRKIPNTRLN